MSANFKTYSAYKDFGVEWLEEVSAHWEVVRLRPTEQRGCSWWQALTMLPRMSTCSAIVYF